MEKVRYMISDAATMAGVESHVLRYWEDELDLTIPRNEMGHRYYTRENILEFQRIKDLKEQGYQLKAIRTILHSSGETPAPPAVMNAAPADSRTAAPVPAASAADSRTAVTVSAASAADSRTAVPAPAAEEHTAVTVSAASAADSRTAVPVPVPAASAAEERPAVVPVHALSAEDRMEQFRELMSDIVGRAISQNNEELSLNISEEVRETVLKEMNYLFREQEEANEERFKRLDAAIRGSLRRKRPLFSKADKPAKPKKEKVKKADRASKQKTRASLT